MGLAFLPRRLLPGADFPGEDTHFHFLSFSHLEVPGLWPLVDSRGVWIPTLRIFGNAGHQL